MTAATAPPRVRATSGGGTRPPSAASKDAATTAEIPRVTAPSHADVRPGYARPVVRRTRARREPAPISLRLLVWTLFFLFLVTSTGLGVEHFHPKWISFLRNGASTSAQTSTTGPPSTTPTPVRLALQSTSPSGATYSVPASSYTIVLVIRARCYVTLRSPADAKVIAFAATISPQMSPKDFSVQGSASFEIAAQAVSLTIKQGSRIFGTIPTPKVGFTYTFQPQTS